LGDDGHLVFVVGNDLGEFFLYEHLGLLMRV
jgi:hypothetical protein